MRRHQVGGRNASKALERLAAAASTKHGPPSNKSFGRRRIVERLFGVRVRPVLLDECQAVRPTLRLMNYYPASRDGNVAWPQGVLFMVIYKHMINSILVFKWIGHVLILSAERRLGLLMRP
jgi:hypothetical protein